MKHVGGLEGGNAPAPYPQTYLAGNVRARVEGLRHDLRQAQTALFLDDHQSVRWWMDRAHAKLHELERVADAMEASCSRS